MLVRIIAVLSLLVVVFVASNFQWSEAKAITVVNTRPVNGTIACRDAQVFKLRSLIVHVDHNPLGNTSYAEGNAMVDDLLTVAEQLQAVCR